MRAMPRACIECSNVCFVKGIISFDNMSDALHTYAVSGCAFVRDRLWHRVPCRVVVELWLIDAQRHGLTVWDLTSNWRHGNCPFSGMDHQIDHFYTLCAALWSKADYLWSWTYVYECLRCAPPPREIEEVLVDIMRKLSIYILEVP